MWISCGYNVGILTFFDCPIIMRLIPQTHKILVNICEDPFACNWSHTHDMHYKYMKKTLINTHMIQRPCRWDCKHRMSYPEVGDVDLGWWVVNQACARCTVMIYAQFPADDWKSVSLGEDISNISWPARIHIWRFPKMGVHFDGILHYTSVWVPPFMETPISMGDCRTCRQKPTSARDPSCFDISDSHLVAFAEVRCCWTKQREEMRRIRHLPFGLCLLM